MRSNPRVRPAALILLAMGLAAFAGCATGAKQPMARGLNQQEAETAQALEDARRSNQEIDLEVESNPERLEAQGDSMALNRDWMGALLQYQRALSLAAPKNRPRLEAKSAEICLRARQFAQAEEIFKRISAKKPDRADAWQGLGLAYMGQGKHDAAHAALNKAVSLKPQLWKAQNALGIIATHRRQPELAIKHFDQALAQGPAKAELYNNRGMAHLLLGKYNQAEADFRRALALDDKFELAANNLALLMAKNGRLPEALNYFSQGSGSAQAHNNLGCWLAWQGSHQKAKEHFQAAQNVEPRYYPLANQHLAQVGDKAAEPGPAFSRTSKPIKQPQVKKVTLSLPADKEVLAPVASGHLASAGDKAAEAGPAFSQTSEPIKQPQVKKVTVSRPEDKQDSLPEPAGKKLMAQKYKHLPEGLVGFLSQDKKVKGVVADSRGRFEPVVAPASPGQKQNPPEPVKAKMPDSLAKAPDKPATASTGAPETAPVKASGPDLASQAVAEKSTPQPSPEQKARMGEHPGIWHGTMPPVTEENPSLRPAAETPVQGDTRDKT